MERASRFSFYSRVGQSTLVMCLAMGLGTALFSWVAGASLERRQNEARVIVQKNSLRALEQRLRKALRSPNFVNKNFFEVNPEIRDFLQDLNPSERAPLSQHFVAKILDADGEDWLGGASRHARLDFANCNAQDQRCPFASEVTADFKSTGAVGFVNLKVKFHALDARPFNSENEENQLSVVFPLNLYGVKQERQKIYCKRGFKVFKISENPGDFLCLVDM